MDPAPRENLESLRRLNLAELPIQRSGEHTRLVSSFSADGRWLAVGEAPASLGSKPLPAHKHMKDNLACTEEQMMAILAKMGVVKLGVADADKPTPDYNHAHVIRTDMANPPRGLPQLLPCPAAHLRAGLELYAHGRGALANR